MLCALPPKSSSFIGETFSDESCILSGLTEAGVGVGSAKHEKDKKNKEKKKKESKVDVPTLRLRTATKLLPHIKFAQAAFREMQTKLDEFYKEHCDSKAQADRLREKGVTEERIIQDASLQLGDDVGCIRIMFTVMDRHRLLQFLSAGSDSMALLEGDDLADASAEASALLKKDAFLSEEAKDIKAFVEYNNPEKLYEPLSTKAEIEDKHADLMKTVKAVKACIAAAKRSISDFNQMVKSTKKAREKFDEQLKKAKKPSIGHGGLQGRPNLGSMAATDPEILRNYKLLAS